MNNHLSPSQAVIACRNAAGSDSQMARDLNISQPKAWRIINHYKQMPPHLVLKAEQLYGVSRHDLRPDIYPRNYPPAPARKPRTSRSAAA